MQVSKFIATAIAVAAVAALVATPAWAGGGNSDAAKTCQKDGYKDVVGTSGNSFNNSGDCTSYAARGGSFFSGIVVPAGKSMVFHAMMVNACDGVAYGYQPTGGANVTVDTKADCRDGGAAQSFPGDVTVGPFSTTTATTVRIFLTDTTCGATFYSDGNHALVTPTGPASAHVDIMDAGPDCSSIGVARAPSQPGYGNFSVELQFVP